MSHDRKVPPVALAAAGLFLFCGIVLMSVPNLQRATISAEKSRIYGMATTAAQAAEGEPKTVKTWTLTLTVKDPAQSCEKIMQVAEEIGGFVVKSERMGDGEGSSAALSVRVPAGRFEEAKSQIRKLAVHVDIERVDAKDVTKDYVDREARLRNLRAQEVQYLGILRRATTIKDTLEVTGKIDEVRGTIEQQQGEFDELSKEVETVALTISLMADQQAQVFGLHWRPLYQLKLAAQQGLDSIGDYATVMATFLFYLPAVLLWLGTIAIGAALGWRILRWAGKALFVPKPKAA